MKTRLTIAYIGNLIDIISTLYFTSIGFVEINPIMVWLLQWPMLLITVKIVVMTAAVILFWYARNEICAVIASWIICLMYGSIALYYVWFFIQVFG